jgi:hypothetical protein
MADEPSVLAMKAEEPVGEASIDWVAPVRDRRRLFQPVNGSSVGAGRNLKLPHPSQPRRKTDLQPVGGSRFSATAAR